MCFYICPVNTFTLALEDSTVSEPLTVEETEGGSLGPITITRNEATIFTYIVTLGTRPNTSMSVLQYLRQWNL